MNLVRPFAEFPAYLAGEVRRLTDPSPEARLQANERWQAMRIPRLVRDGQVAVVLSASPLPWVLSAETAQEQLVKLYSMARLVLTTPGLTTFRVEWVPLGASFRVVSAGGREELVLLDPAEWFVA